MLSGFPVEVRVRGSGLNVLANRMVNEPWLQGIDMDEERSSLTIRVSDKSAFQSRLVELACLPEIRVASLESPDGSLEAAFELLLSVHRGEHTI